MKKFFIICAIALSVLSMTSCTQNNRAKNFGGTATIILDKGQKLIEATWKDNELWYLTEPMEENYVPKTKIFKEESSWGVMEGKVIFIERSNGLN